MPRKRKRLHQLLADSLRAAKEAATDGIVRSTDLERGHKERLVASGSLTEIIRGWYLLTSPDSGGGSTAWFGGFWDFLRHYLKERFGENGYCLSAESSLNLHAGDTSIPRQIIILTKKASNANIELLYDTSVLLITEKKNFPEKTKALNGVRVMPLPLSLCRLSPSYFQNIPRNVEIILKLSNLAVADISGTLLKIEAIASAERIIGAFQVLGDMAKAAQIQGDLEAAGYSLKKINPFKSYEPKLKGVKFTSPYAGRIRLLWGSMRDEVAKLMPVNPGLKADKNTTIRVIQETYREDAYHSLSIEGYQVTEELIEKIETGEWDPENIQADKEQKDAMAAKGYYNAFQVVVNSVMKALNQKGPGSILEDDLQSWYRELFAPTVKANLFPMERLAGYRNGQVYIKNSRHVPPPRTAVLDCMEVLFELLKGEENAFVRGVLGHFIFVYIHPYMDGNGRMGRFLMNLMFVSGGIPWTIIKTSNRDRYMKALEAASTKENILPFAEFVKNEMN